MTEQTSYTSAEWNMLGDAALAACAAIALSEPGGGSREADAVTRGWREVAEMMADSPLIQTLVRKIDPMKGGQPTPARSSGQPTFDDVVDEALHLCRQAVDLLAERGTPEDLEDYQYFVLFLARRVAGASTEGGIFGLGGEPISRGERAVLHGIGDALGYKRPGDRE
jgi:hypothetical protein